MHKSLRESRPKKSYSCDVPPSYVRDDRLPSIAQSMHWIRDPSRETRRFHRAWLAINQIEHLR